MPEVKLTLRLAGFHESPARFVLQVERAGTVREYRCANAEEVIGRAVAVLFAGLGSRRPA